MNAIRAMIAYYRESRDKSILPVIRRIKNGMMLPVSEGGTVAISPEGGIWIEEFPTDPPSLALGSFIGSINALHEIARIFPDDRQTRKEFESAVASLKASLMQYDSGNWMYIYRWPPLNRPAMADDGYGSGLPRVLLDLWKTSRDPLFLATSLRWQSFFENVHFNSTGNMRPDKLGTYRVAPGLPKGEQLRDALKNNYEIASSSPEALKEHGPDKLFDDNIDTYLSTVPAPAHIHLRLKEPRLVNTLRLTLYNVELYPENLAIEIKAKGKDGFKSVSFERESSRRSIYYRFDPLWTHELRITASRFSKQDRLVISGLALGSMNWQNRDKPTYCNHTTPPVELDGRGFYVVLKAPLKSAKQIYVMYRHAPNRVGLESSPWQWDFIDPFESNKITKVVGDDRIYQFRVLCTPEAGHRGWRGLTILNRDNKVAYEE
jgi:hypothetical protein